MEDPRYIEKKAQNKLSYLWDALIEGFTTSMLSGTSIVPQGHDFDLKKSELSIRHMALQSRFARRCHSQAIAGALESGRTQDKFFRLMLPEPGSKESDTAFFILTMKYLDWMEARGGYEHYRQKRSELAVVYGRGILERFPYLQRVVGISREPPDQGRDLSEDLTYVMQTDWSAEERKAIREDCKSCGVLQNRMKVSHHHEDEFPETDSLTSSPTFSPKENRKQRRRAAAEARSRK